MFCSAQFSESVLQFILVFTKAIRSTFLIDTCILVSKDALVITVAGDEAIHRRRKSPVAGRKGKPCDSSRNFGISFSEFACHILDEIIFHTPPVRKRLFTHQAVATIERLVSSVQNYFLLCHSNGWRYLFDKNL